MVDEDSKKEKGERLLRYFRQEQAKHGNDGCLCSECKDDMVKALRRCEDGLTK